MQAWMYQFVGLPQVVWRKAVSIHRSPASATDGSNMRIAVLGGNAAWTLEDAGIVVRSESFADDGGSVMVSLCHIGEGNDCSACATPRVPDAYWQLRAQADIAVCIAVDTATHTAADGAAVVAKERALRRRRNAASFLLRAPTPTRTPPTCGGGTASCCATD
jgi:hypothetical protein